MFTINLFDLMKLLLYLIFLGCPPPRYQIFFNIVYQKIKY